MKYLAHLAACVVVVTALAAPATAAETTTDPVRVTFPQETRINPAHTPYVVQVDDPEPERGDLVLAWSDQRLDLPHQGSATVPLTSEQYDVVYFDVLRCDPADHSQCVDTGQSGSVGLVTSLYVDVRRGHPLGPHSRLPVRFSPTLDPGDVIHLDWTLSDLRHDQGTIVASSADYVVGDPLPTIGVPTGIRDTVGRLSVHAVSDSVRLGELGGTGTQDYQVDVTAPPLPVHVQGDALFPAHDGYLDKVAITFSEAAYDLNGLNIDLISPDGAVERIEHGIPGNRSTVYIRGSHQGRERPPGRYTIRVTGRDKVGNATVERYPLHVDDRHLVERTFSHTYPAARTVVDRYVGACSHLGPAAGRGWKQSLGLYSSACRQKNGAVVATVHRVRIPSSVDGYDGSIMLQLYGGAARGESSAYLVQGWLRASDGSFVDRNQLDGRLGTHLAGRGYPDQVVRTVHGRSSVAWQLGLSEGSRYDIRSFTVRCTYYALAR